MKYIRQNKRAASLAIAVLSLMVLVVWPKGFYGSMYIVSVSLFSGLVATLIFVRSSITEIKDIAEQMTDEYQMGNQ